MTFKVNRKYETLDDTWFYVKLFGSAEITLTWVDEETVGFAERSM